MMQRHCTFRILYAFTYLLLGFVSAVSGYEVQTHEVISRQAARRSIVDQELKGSLGILGGLEETVAGKSLEDWVAEGSRLEDEGGFFGFRYRNHFHNPLRLWDDAGLRVSLPPPLDFLGVQLGQSSILWGQNQNQDRLPFNLGGGNWSWQNTRQRYLEALTGADRKERKLNRQEREEALAEIFRGLGHLIHLIQDAASPAHTRNDFHYAYNYESLVLGLQTGESSFFQGLLGNPIAPSPGWEKLASNPLAPLPIARLLDTERYRLSRIPEAGTNIGLAEYTNANFFSEDTTFNENLESPQGFPFPARSSVQEADYTITLPTGEKVRRKYYQKVADGDTGYRLATVGVLRDYLQRFGLDPDRFNEKPALDESVYKDYASRLLPRAVGYSAGLLDYFFRGRLDVDLVPDPDSSDPTVVKLSGTNGSPDKLDGGTLALYADDPVTGERSPVPALNPNFTVVADPGQPVESAKFQINTETERFMAVYKGKLGEEKPEGDFSGAVIGKVLGGVRAESIFPQANKWMLRTVDGVFALPPTADRLQNIQWGDQDNTFVGTLSNSSNLNSPDQVVAFKINRPIGSPEKPPLEGPGGAEVVSADILKAANFPFGLPLGVTVNYSQTIQFKQLLVTHDSIAVFAWGEHPDVPGASGYQRVSWDIRVQEPELVVDKTLQFQQSFPIVLDLAHLSGVGSSFRPYVWSVREVFVDSQQRLMALVQVFLTQPENNIRSVKLRARNLQGQMIDRLDRQVFGFFEIPGPIWALIDVERGEVIGATSASTFALLSQRAETERLIQSHILGTFIEGPTPGTQENWSDIQSDRSPNPNYTDIVTDTVMLPVQGLISLALPGQFRPDLESLVGKPVEISSTTFEDSVLYFVDPNTMTNRFIRFVDDFSFRSGTRTLSSEPRRIPSVTGGDAELLLLFHQEGLQSFTVEAQLVRWPPQTPSNTAAALSLPPASFYGGLQFTTSEAALLEGWDCDVDFSFCDPFTLLVDLVTKETQKFSGQSLGFDYVLLDPKFLYNITDTKFHTLDPSLRPTALPRSLASAPTLPSPYAAYHLIRLR